MSRLLIVAVAMVLVAATVRIWTVICARWLQGKPLIQAGETGDVPWGLLDLIIALGFLFAYNILALAAVQAAWDVPIDAPAETLPVGYHSWKIAAAACASLATLVSTALWIKWRLRASWQQLGFSSVVAVRDIRLGVLAFLAVAPPTYALQYLLVWYFQPDTQHPLIKLLTEHRAPSLILVSFFSAVLVAPLVEEFLFRGLLQGWLEKLARHTVSPRTLVLGDASEPASSVTDHAAETAAAGTTLADNPYCPPRTPAGDPEYDEPGGGDRTDPTSRYMPIFLSSLLFSLMHMSHGPDWVPLFFLALALGYLYQQTHRLLPCVTVHFLLNACSMSMLLVELTPPATP